MADEQIEDINSADGVAFHNVPVELTVTVGQARIPVRELLALERNAVIELDRTVNEPVTVSAGDKVVAYGELQELAESNDGALAVRITRIVDDASAA